MKNLSRRIAVSALSFSPALAFAEAPDVSALVTTINGVLVPVGTVGLATLAVLVGIKLYHYIRRAM